MSRCPVCRSQQIKHFARLEDRDYFRCEICLATFMAQIHWPDSAEARACYLLHENDPENISYRSFLSRLSEPLLHKLRPGSRILDYGCGPGPALAAMLREAGHEVAVFDPVFFADHSVLDRQYDAVTCTEVAEHFFYPADEFDRLSELLSPDGWLAVMTCFQTIDERFANWQYRKDKTHVVFYREATLRHLAEQRGWHCEIPVKNVALMHKPAL